MRQFSASQQINFLITSLIVLNQTFLYSCAEWCSWSELPCKSDLTTCWNYRMRSCNCPAAIGMAETCSGPAEEITEITCPKYSQLRCNYYWSKHYSTSPWCEWNLWSTWTSLDLCTYNENIEQRVRKRQCNCKTDFSSSLCFPGLKRLLYEYSNRSVISDKCSARNWCDWSEWDDCKGTCPTKTQTRSRTCGCSLDRGSFSQCPGGYSKSTENRICSDWTCDDGKIIALKWCDWSEWDNCKGTCPTKTQTRSRTCGCLIDNDSYFQCQYSKPTENRNCSISLCDDGNTFSWIYLFLILIVVFFFVITASVIICSICIRRPSKVQSDGVTVTSTSADMFGNSVNPRPLTENTIADYINDRFDIDLAPPPFSELVDLSDLSPPSYDINEYPAPPPFYEINETSVNVPAAPPSYDEWLETQFVKINI